MSRASLGLSQRRPAEAAQGTVTPRPIPRPLPPLARATSAARPQKHYSQVLHVCDAAERLPRDAQDLVFAQISKPEEKRHTELTTQARLYLHLITMTKPCGGGLGAV